MVPKNPEQAASAYEKAEKHLQQGREWLKQYEALPLYAVFRAQTLRNKMNAALVGAAGEIVSSILPTLSIAKKAFDASMMSCVFKWNVPHTDKCLPIRIYHSDSIAINWSLNGNVVQEVYLSIPPLWCGDGVRYSNVDILEGLIAHEIHHVMNSDGLHCLLRESSDPSAGFSMRQRQEIEADVFACNYSARTGYGFLLARLLDCEFEKQGATLTLDEHLPADRRLQLVQEHTKQYNLGDVDAENIKYLACRTVAEKQKEIRIKTWLVAGFVMARIIQIMLP